MLTIKKIKELLKDKKISDKRAKEIRDGYRNLAEIIFEKYEKEKRAKSNN